MQPCKLIALIGVALKAAYPRDACETARIRALSEVSRPGQIRSGGPGCLMGPFPAGNIRLINAVLVRIVPAHNLFIMKFFKRGATNALKFRNALDRVHSEGETIYLILNREFQRSIDVASFPVTADMHVGMIGSTVSKAMDKPRVSVEVKNNGLIDGE